MSKTVTRLYDQFQPNNYNLKLDIDREKLEFRGNVTITGKKTGRPSERITLHQKGLTIESAKITRLEKSKEKEFVVSRINSQKSFDEVRLHSEESLYPGEYIIQIEFSGKITPAMHGIYPCFFKHEGKDKKLIATQFESHHAREAFPCIDEPAAKATFDLTLVSECDSVVLANTPIRSEKSEDDRKTTTFETSPKMSTYLLAFVHGEMHAVEAKTKDGVVVKSWSTVAQPIEQLNFANAEAVQTLEFFNEYFDTPYPLPKLDQVALPDFDSLAMENWGLITFREVGLLTDPINRSLSSEQMISLVIAHELSHQWFGDLVTMKWWDDLWLNESFASIMENLALAKLHPEWQQWEEFAASRVLSASNRDIYKDVQAVGMDVKHPDEIGSLFDPAIVYAKGARLLSMLFEYLGEDKLRTGLKRYFDAHAYGNATRHDLWKSLSTDTDLDKLMTPWIQQPGQPLLSVDRDGKELKLNQQRFLMDGEDKKSLWPLPLLTDGEFQDIIMETRDLELKLEKAKSPLFNVNGNGHYITWYKNKEDIDNLVNAFSKRDIDSTSRITVLNDMILLARDGKYALSELLNIVAKCEEEPRDAVWSILLRVVSQAQTLTDGDEDVEKDIKKFKLGLSKYWYDKLGWEDKEDDEPNTQHLRTTAIALTIAGENPDAQKHALDMLEKAGSIEKLPAELRGIVAGTAIRYGDAKYVDQLMKEYVSSSNPDVLQSITGALCSTKDPKVAKKIIAWGLQPNGPIKQQDIDHWFAYLVRNHYTRDLAWEWFVKSWDYLCELFSGSKHMEYFVWYSAGPVSTPEWQKKFVDFFEPLKEDPGLKRNILIALSEIQARVDWRKREEANIKEYFSKI